MANFFEQFHEEKEVPQEENFFSQFHTAPTLDLPEPGTYSENDMVESDSAFSVIENYMIDRYGLQSIEGQSRAKIVDDYLDNRRGVAGGNTVRGLSEMDYLNDIEDDEDKMARAHAAAALYENMAGLYTKETTLGEKVRGTGDFIRQGILDPLNIVGGLAGKFIGGGAVRLGTNVAKKKALQKMAEKQAAGASAKVVSQTGNKIFIKAVEEAGKATTNQVKNYSAQLLSSRGLKRLAQKGALAEIATTTSIDAVVNLGMEYLYQNGLIELGVRDDYDKFAMGIAAVGAVGIGGIQAGKIVLRGESKVAAPSVSVTQPEAKDVMKELSESIRDYVNTQVPKSGTWTKKVKGGVELKDLDTDFFVDLLLGHVDDEGNVVLKGLAQIAQERGLVYISRGEGDLYSNWMADVIKQSDPKDIKTFIKAFEKSTGNKLKQAKTLTIEDFANTFALKMNASARVLNAASQGAKLNGTSVKDVQIAEIIDTALDLGFLKGDKTKAEGLSAKLPDFIRNNQNRLIRLLVSNPSTSALNMIGWSANAGINTVSDAALMLLHAGKGTLYKAIGDQKEGKKSYKILRDLANSTYFRVKLLLDPDMTYAAFESALTRNSKALQTLASALPGGIDNVTRLITDGKFTPNQKLIGEKVEDGVNLIQTLSFVKAQDNFTKSQEFIFQMDKQLRLVTGKGWSEFYNWEDAAKFMSTKAYTEIETKAVNKTLENIFSKSYKSSGLIGEVAGIIEDARNIPGVGLLIPFGRFFNNTVDFGLQATGFSIAGKAVGKYSDKTWSELAAKSLVSYGFALSMLQEEARNRKAGLGLYQESVKGEVITRQYDYPISFFKAAARLGTYMAEGENPPPELVKQIARDFTLEGLLRNLDKTQQDVAGIFFHMFQLDLKESWKAFGKSIGGIGSQVISSSTRFIEPINTLAGIVSGEQARPIDRYQGNKFYNDSTRYVDNILPIFLGKSIRGKTLKQAAIGEADITSTKSLGIRSIRLTDTQRVMNMLGYDTFSLNAARKIRMQAPEAANEYNGILFDIIEAKSSALMDSKAFRNEPLERQRLYWTTEILPEAKELAKSFLYLQYSGPLDTIDLQYELSNKYSNKKIDDAVKELNFNGNIGDMTRAELYVLKEYLSTVDQIQRLKIPAEVGAKQYKR